MNKKIIISFLLLFLLAPTPTSSAGKCTLAFSVIPDKSYVGVGDTVNYAITVENLGTATCKNTAYSFQYSDNERYVSGTPLPRSGDYYWNVGNLAPNKQYKSSLTTKIISNIVNSIKDTESWATADSAVDVYATPVVVIADSSTPAVPNEPLVPSKPTVPPESSLPSTTTPVNAATVVQAWVYSGNPACNAPNEYSDGRNIDTLKPEYYTVSSDGTLRLKTVASDGCNAYSPYNVSDIKTHSKNQFVTVSANASNMSKLLSSDLLRNSAIKTLTDFAVQIGFSGVELDWEGFGSWTASDYSSYKSFVTSLQKSLHENSKLLMIDAPAIPDAKYQGYFQFKYEDFTQVDYVTIMAYDYQYDFGAGEPVAPDAWIINTVNWAKNRLPLDKIIIGVASYGYHGALGSYNIKIDTYMQSSTYPGFSNRKFNSDGEMSWIDGGVYYAVQETSTLDQKMKLIESLGIKSISLWHLGGNQWFSKI